MEIAGVSEFLHEVGLNNNINMRLIPPRLILDTRNDVQLTVCICDGRLYLEDITNVTTQSCRKPLADIDLADPESFDILLEAIYAGSGGRDAVGGQSVCASDPSGLG